MKDGYERDFLRYLQSLLAEVERRIRRGHARLALSQAQQNAGVGANCARPICNILFQSFWVSGLTFCILFPAGCRSNWKE